MELPLWSIPIGTLCFTSVFFLAQHMDYSVQEWLLGNGIISLGVCVVYVSGGMYKKIKDG